MHENNCIQKHKNDDDNDNENTVSKHKTETMGRRYEMLVCVFKQVLSLYYAFPKMILMTMILYILQLSETYHYYHLVQHCERLRAILHLQRTFKMFHLRLVKVKRERERERLEQTV